MKEENGDGEGENGGECLVIAEEVINDSIGG